MRRRHTNKFILLIIIMISIGFAILSVSLGIFGKLTIKKASLNVHFDNLEAVNTNIVEGNDPTIYGTDKKAIYYNQALNPADYIEFRVDVINESGKDAKLTEYGLKAIINDVEQDMPYYLTTSIKYSDGTKIQNRDKLEYGQSRNITVYIKYRDDLSLQDLVRDEVNLSIKVVMNYEEFDNNQPEALCMRVDYSDEQGTPLKAGDKLICDVNGDGNYDEEEEKFYFVSNSYINGDFDSDSAALIYHSNISAAAHTYCDNTEGPCVAASELPDSDFWSAVTPITNRNIYDSNGNFVLEYTYNKAARFLTVQELLKATGQSTLYFNIMNYPFLSENFDSGITNSYWLENIDGTNRFVVDGSMNWGIESWANYNSRLAGVRPVIDVLLTDIDY